MAIRRDPELEKIERLKHVNDSWNRSYDSFLKGECESSSCAASANALLSLEKKYFNESMVKFVEKMHFELYGIPDTLGENLSHKRII